MSMSFVSMQFLTPQMSIVYHTLAQTEMSLSFEYTRKKKQNSKIQLKSNRTN